ncbi:hypothetical protein APHWI1_0986 [Anaplasma phagocytophilum str. ApWI1]|uniref:Uncharacterized protein n=1 Tax=Anaplasma phagocytophilum str. ApWI1 TaxID=1359155 RepID=A0A0F3PXJ4_ANAPH|nr:hypothetical protein APHWI1_0986 [Anaplasma phagocytophilum str. ApWI1]
MRWPTFFPPGFCVHGSAYYEMQPIYCYDLLSYQYAGIRNFLLYSALIQMMPVISFTLLLITREQKLAPRKAIMSFVRATHQDYCWISVTT